MSSPHSFPIIRSDDGRASAGQAIAQAIELISFRHPHTDPLLVFITGRDCSGKTTFTAMLQEALTDHGYTTEIVHVDDFHHPKRVRYAPGVKPHEAYLQLSFDHDKLVDDLLWPVRSGNGRELTLQLLDLPTDEYTLIRSYQITKGTIVLVEGVFLLLERFAPYRDLTIYLETSVDTVLSRAFLRDWAVLGHDVHDRYLCKYLPAQLSYEASFVPRRLADLIIETETFATHRNDQEPFKFSTGSDPDTANNAPIEAVVFDLWETLVPLPRSSKEATRLETAAVLGLPLAEFDRLWSRDRSLRETISLDTYLFGLCAELKVPRPDEVIEAIRGIRQRHHEPCFRTPTREAVATLRMLRHLSVRTGILSNCTSDVERYLSSCPLGQCVDEVALSASMGLMKPDIRLFQAIAGRLGVDATACLYVGDGSDGELSGAKAAGMTPVLIRTAKVVPWDGVTIDHLSSVVGLAVPFS